MTAGELAHVMLAALPDGMTTAALAALDAGAAPDLMVAVADDLDSEPGVRVAALLAVAIAATTGARLPIAALDVLEDDLLVDEAIARGATAALTGVLAAADPAPERTRRYLALRLDAMRCTGVHVAALELAAGDLAAAIRAFVPAVRACTSADEHAALACLAIQWTAAHGHDLADALADALSAGDAATLAASARGIGAGHDHPLIVRLETRAHTRG